MANTPINTIAVIPARGDSKRLPGKALLPFNDKPMIAITIEAAIASNCFSKIVVSSDNDTILGVASEYGATPYKRDASLSDDKTPTAPVLLDILESEESQGQYWDVLACLYATAPLRTATDIENVMSLIEPGTCDFAMAVCECERPIHQALLEDVDGVLRPVWPESVGINSQEVGRYLFGNGSTYAVTVSAFLETKSLYGPGLRGYEMPLSRSVDLNTTDDLNRLNLFATSE
ncbi:MAG: cytidylyltransferase domain-containing protein [Rhodospirillaceae bacterium]